MQKPEPVFPITAQHRKRVVDAAMKLVANNDDAVATIGINAILEMERQNLEASQPKSWTGKSSNN